MQKSALEDHAADVIQKAAMGMRSEGVSFSEDDQKLIERTLHALESEQIEDEMLNQVAKLLRLNAQALLQLAHQPWIVAPALPEQIHRIELPFGPYTVNSWAILLNEERYCMLFDTGTRAQELLTYLDQHNLQPAVTFITHDHPDHTGGLSDLCQCFPSMQVFAPSPNKSSNIHPIRSEHSVPGLRETLQTWQMTGHTPDGQCFLFRIQETLCCVVGDVLFARSIGKTLHQYSVTLENTQSRVLGLHPETLLLPGHGPATTVHEERTLNPFFSRPETRSF